MTATDDRSERADDPPGESGEPAGSAEEAAEQEVDTENVGNLGDILPDPLKPLYQPIEAFYAFRRTHGDKYVKVMEAIVALVLAGGYIWWLSLFLSSG